MNAVVFGNCFASGATSGSVTQKRAAANSTAARKMRRMRRIIRRLRTTDYGRKPPAPRGTNTRTIAS
jgi:hypothetical protein